MLPQPGTLHSGFSGVSSTTQSRVVHGEIGVGDGGDIVHRLLVQVAVLGPAGEAIAKGQALAIRSACLFAVCQIHGVDLLIESWCYPNQETCIAASASASTPDHAVTVVHGEIGVGDRRNILNSLLVEITVLGCPRRNYR